MKNRILRKVIACTVSMVMILIPAIPGFAAESTTAQGGMQQGMQQPSGEAPTMQDGSVPEKPSGDDQAPGDDQGQGGPGGGGNSAVTGWNSALEVTEDKNSDGETFASTGTDENAIHVSGGNAVFANPTITKNSSDSTGGDNSSFYGVGAAVLTTGGNTYIKNGSITTDSKGGAGAFSYGDGVTYISGTTISTTQDTSGGIHVAGGGKLYAWDVSATTNGESSAAIRSDRGGGTMVVDGGTYTSNGTGSPAVYCTADIDINNADLTATNSEGICIEGLNSLSLYGCDLTSDMPDNEQNDTTWSVILYQSQSGDSQEGNSTYEMVGGTLTSKNGGLFYTTNTESTFYINNVSITSADDSEFFLRATGNSNQRGWGSTGANGADCNFTADSQKMNGDVIWDTISKLDLYLINGSVLTGAVTDDETNAGSGGDGYCNLYISSDSHWIVTGNSTVTNLFNEGTIVDANGNQVKIVGTDGTVYEEGTSEYTITVTSYSETADFSGCTYQSSGAPSFDTCAVTKPSQLMDEIETSETTAVSTESVIVEETESKATPVAIVFIIAAAVVIVGAVVTVIIVDKKKKPHKEG